MFLRMFLRCLDAAAAVVLLRLFGADRRAAPCEALDHCGQQYRREREAAWTDNIHPSRRSETSVSACIPLEGALLQGVHFYHI